MDEVIAEWWTGRDANGQESPHAKWRDVVIGGLQGRTFERRIETLSAMLCKASIADYVRVRIATGADGEPDVRIETEVSGQATAVVRWRPADGASLLDVIERGSTPRQRRANDPARATRLVQARTADATTMDAETAFEALATLKAHRHVVLEKRESAAIAGASTAELDAELAAIASRLQTVRSRYETELVKVRAARSS